MTLEARKSRWAPVAVALTALALGVPVSAPAAAPGIGEYTLEKPDAGGEGNIGPEEPRPRPQDLPPEVRKELAGDPDGETLTKIATAHELGAPDRDLASAGAGSSGEDSSALAATANSLDDGGTLALVGVLAAIVGGAVVLARRRRPSV